MRVSSDYIYGIVLRLCSSAADVAAFVAALEAVIVSGVDAVNKGKVLVGTSSGGTGVQYALPPLGSYTAEDVLSAYVQLHREVEALVAANDSITKAELCAALRAKKRGTNRIFYRNQMAGGVY